MVPKSLEKQFSDILKNRSNNKKIKRETRKEKLERIKNMYGFSHGKGKRKRRTKKRGGGK